MKEIELTQGFKALVDDEDYPLLSRHSWHVIHSGKTQHYATMTFRGMAILMHHLIVPSKTTGPRRYLDHSNGNGCDNRKENLRFASRSENARNCTAQVGTSSKFKGVCWHKGRQQWTAGIWLEGRRQHLGYYEDEILAALVYDEEALKQFGRFSRLNIFMFPLKDFR